MDAASATSRVPAAGVRLSESLAESHEVRAGTALEQARHWSAEAATARTAAASDSAAMVERFSHDVRTGLTHARGVTESQNLSAQRLESHLEKLSQAGGITKEQAAVLTGEARVGGGFDFIVKFGADGSASWRGQTFGRETWNRMTDYAGQNQLLDHWSRVSDASRRYATASGESELKSLDESLGANMTRMRRFSEQEAVSRREAENWSSQAAQVRGRSQSIDSELGQPFFAWLSARTGADGREIGAAGAMRLASPQTTEDSEVLRAHAAAFIAERFPVSGGPEAAPGPAGYERAREELRESGVSGTAAAWAGWSDSVRERARGAGTPGPGDAGERAARGRAEIETELDIREAGRVARAGSAEESIEQGRPKIAAEADRPFIEHAAREVPLVGEWLGGKLYGTAKNAAPGPEGKEQDEKKEREAGSAFSGDQVMGP